MGKKGWWVLFFVILLVAAVVVSGIFFLIYRYTPQEPTTLTEQIFLTVIAVGVSIFITWIFSRRIAHEDLKRAAARAVRLIENTKKDAAALYDKALEERGQVSKELENYPESKKVVDRCFDWLIYSLERLKGRISDGRDDWRDFLPEEFEQQRELQAEENELRAERDASVAQLQEMLRVEMSKGKQVRDLAEKLENLEERLGVIEATPSPITGAPREAPVRDAYYWFRQGLRYSARGQYEEAIEAYDKTLEIRKDYPDARYNKGCAFALLGQKQGMLEALKEAVRLDPKNKEDAKKDEDFRAYWEDEDFKAIVR